MGLVWAGRQQESQFGHLMSEVIAAKIGFNNFKCHLIIGLCTSEPNKIASEIQLRRLGEFIGCAGGCEQVRQGDATNSGICS